MKKDTMGAVNYHTRKYVTLGLEPYGFDEYTDENGETDFDERWEDMEVDAMNVECILKKYRFHYFNVTIQAGYYEGFSIDIDDVYSIYDDAYDKRDALREATQVRRFLIECANAGLCACRPGWCTAYLDYKETLKEINRATKEMKDEIKHTPTWASYRRKCYAAC